MAVDDVCRSVHAHIEPVPQLKGRRTWGSTKSHNILVQMKLPPELYDTRIDLYVDIVKTKGARFC